MAASHGPYRPPCDDAGGQAPATQATARAGRSAAPAPTGTPSRSSTDRLRNPPRSFFRLLFDNRPEGESTDGGHTAFEAGAFTALVALIQQGQDEGYLIDGDPRRIAGYMTLAPHGLAHYLSQPDAPGTNPQGPLPLLPPEELGLLASIPVMRNPPDPAPASRIARSAMPDAPGCDRIRNDRVHGNRCKEPMRT